MNQPSPSAVEQARAAWRRAVEETQQSWATAREQAESELRRRWALLRDAVDEALAVGMSLEDVARRLGLAPAALRSVMAKERAFGRP